MARKDSNVFEEKIGRVSFLVEAKNMMSLLKNQTNEESTDE